MRRLAFVLIVVAAMAYNGYGADIYVATTGDNTTGDGTSGNPYRSLQKALDNATVNPTTIHLGAGTYGVAGGDSDTYWVLDGTNAGVAVTIQPNSTAAVTLVASATYMCLRVADTMTSGSLTLTNGSGSLAVTSSSGGGANYPRLVESTGDGIAITIDCSVGATGSAQQYGVYYYGTTNTTRDLTVTGNAVITGSIAALNILSADTVTVRDGATLINEGVGNGINVANTVNYLDVGNVTITCSPDVVSNCVMGDTLTACTWVRLVGGTYTAGRYGIYLPTYVTSVLIDGVTATNNNATVAAIVICVGVNHSSNAHPLGTVVVRNCTASFAGSAVHHAILIGSGCDGAEVSHNYASGGDYQMVVKSEYVNVHHNILYGPLSLYLKGAGYCSVWNNTLYATSSNYAFSWVSDTDDPVGNRVFNNIIVADGASYCLYNDTDPENMYGILMDRNLLYATGNGKLALFRATEYNSISALKGYWQGISSFIGTDNDTYSLCTNPLLRNPAGADFRLESSSPALNTGYVTLGPGRSTIGAWQPNAVQNVSQRSRYDFQDIYGD